LEKGLIKMMGRKDLPGRPIVYGTTRTFLELFSLNTLSDLPSLQEIQPPPVPAEGPPEEIIPQEKSEEATTKEEIPRDCSLYEDSVAMSLRGGEATEAISKGAEKK
jgi:segregation and condensation protein B